VGKCEEQDSTGNYEKARKGDLAGFPGVNAPYEEPVNPEILLEADKEDVEQCTKKILRTLELLEWIPKVAGSDYNEEEEEKITKRLKDLGYI
jgi:adenylylsulfate kinase